MFVPCIIGHSINSVGATAVEMDSFTEQSDKDCCVHYSYR